MLTLRVNATFHKLEVDPSTPLLWVLREQLGLVGSKFSCGIGECGACTVHVDGKPTLSCVTPTCRLGPRRGQGWLEAKATEWDSSRYCCP